MQDPEKSQRSGGAPREPRTSNGPRQKRNPLSAKLCTCGSGRGGSRSLMSKPMERDNAAFSEIRTQPVPSTPGGTALESQVLGQLEVQICVRTQRHIHRPTDVSAPPPHYLPQRGRGSAACASCDPSARHVRPWQPDRLLAQRYEHCSQCYRHERLTQRFGPAILRDQRPAPTQE